MSHTKDNKHEWSFSCGILCGLLQTIIFNPFDRALYLALCYDRNLFNKLNWLRCYDGFFQSIIHRTLSNGLYYPIEKYVSETSAKMRRDFGVNNEISNLEKDLWQKVQSLSPFSCIVDNWSHRANIPKHNQLTDSTTRRCSKSSLDQSSYCKSTFDYAVAGTVAGLFNAIILHPLAVLKHQYWADPKYNFVHMISLTIFPKGSRVGLQIYNKAMLSTVLRDVIFGVTFSVSRNYFMNRSKSDRYRKNGIIEDLHSSNSPCIKGSNSSSNSSSNIYNSGSSNCCSNPTTTTITSTIIPTNMCIVGKNGGDISSSGPWLFRSMLLDEPINFLSCFMKNFEYHLPCQTMSHNFLLQFIGLFGYPSLSFSSCLLSRSRTNSTIGTSSSGSWLSGATAPSAIAFFAKCLCFPWSSHLDGRLVPSSNSMLQHPLVAEVDKSNIVGSGCIYALNSLLQHSEAAISHSFIINSLCACLSVALVAPINYVRQMKLACSPFEKPPSASTIVASLVVAARRLPSKCNAILYVVDRFKIGWGTVRVSVGMSFSAWIYDTCMLFSDRFA